jgi:hypothetical protein
VLSSAFTHNAGQKRVVAVHAHQLANYVTSITCLLFRFREATNMTDRMAALTVLCDTDTPGREQALQVGVAPAVCAV